MAHLRRRRQLHSRASPRCTARPHPRPPPFLPRRRRRPPLLSTPSLAISLRWTASNLPVSLRQQETLRRASCRTGPSSTTSTTSDGIKVASLRGRTRVLQKTSASSASSAVRLSRPTRVVVTYHVLHSASSIRSSIPPSACLVLFASLHTLASRIASASGKIYPSVLSADRSPLHNLAHWVIFLHPPLLLLARSSRRQQKASRHDTAAQQLFERERRRLQLTQSSGFGCHVAEGSKSKAILDRVAQKLSKNKSKRRSFLTEPSTEEPGNMATGVRSPPLAAGRQVGRSRRTMDSRSHADAAAAGTLSKYWPSVFVPSM